MATSFLDEGSPQLFSDGDFRGQMARALREVGLALRAAQGGVLGSGSGFVVPQLDASPSADNADAIQAAIATAAAAGGGAVLIPSGTYRYVSHPLDMRSNVSLIGLGPQSVLFYDPRTNPPISNVDRFAVRFEGRYTDYPAVRPVLDDHPGALIGMAPAVRGATTITAVPTGGFANVSVGDWILLAEGPPPKWNVKFHYNKVIAKAGDTLTLLRSLDLDFDGSTGNAFGAIRITPVENAWIRDLTLRSSARATFGAFGCGVVVRGGMVGVTFDPEFDPVTRLSPIPYANDVHQFTIERCLFTTGNFGGFNRSSYSRFIGNLLPAVNDADCEHAEGAAFCTIAFNRYSGCIGANPVIGVGTSYYTDIIGNTFAGVRNNCTIKVVGSQHGRILNNQFTDVRQYAISIGVSNAAATGMYTRNWIVSGNDVELVAGLPVAIEYPAIAVFAYPNVENVIVANNHFSHPIKIGAYGDARDDRTSIRVSGNTGSGALVQADSAAADVASLRADFNNLLAKLRGQGIVG